MNQDASNNAPRRLSIFPLPGAIMFPGLQLPLHIFEPRYRAMIGDAMVRDRQIGMIQPMIAQEGARLFEIGCVGRMANVEAMDDGRYNIVLEGITKFRLVRELEVKTPFRQVEAELIEECDDAVLSSVERAAVESEARTFASVHGYQVNWDAVERLDDASFINGTAQIVPFDIAAKQALLEAPDLSTRADLLCQLLQFFSRTDGEDEITTLQ